ncbi:hypothetical protein Tco_0330172, partial [Tanacetum coccineum]
MQPLHLTHLSLEYASSLECCTLAVPLGCDPLALVDSFTLVEDNIGLLETRFDVEAKDVTGSVNLTLLSLFFGVTTTNFPSVLLILGQ